MYPGDDIKQDTEWYLAEMERKELEIALPRQGEPGEDAAFRKAEELVEATLRTWIQERPGKSCLREGESDVMNASGDSGHYERQEKKGRPGSRADVLRAAIANNPYLIAKEPIGRRGGAQSLPRRRRDVDLARTRAPIREQPTASRTVESWGSNWATEGSAGDPYLMELDDIQQVCAEDLAKEL